jgi:hypothetical protein
MLTKEQQERLERVQRLFREPLLLPDEDPAAYDALLTTVTAAVQPADILERIWTSEAVEKEWEAVRQRRFKTGLLAANRQRALTEILRPLLSYGFADASDDEAHMLAWQFTLGNGDAIKKVNEHLEKAHLTMTSVDAQAMAMSIATFESLDRLIWAAEARRDALLDMIERRRAAFGHKLRRTLSELERSETAQIEGAPEPGTTAAAEKDGI